MPDTWDFNQRPQRVSGDAPTPLLTYFMCAACVIATLAYHTSDSMPGTLWYRIGHFGVPPITEIWSGHYIGLFTSVFVHVGLLHLLFDMYWLVRLGRVLEQTLHPLVYALFFLIATVVSSGAQIALSSVIGVGASGIGYAMFGLLWAGRARYPTWRTVATRENLNLFIIWGIFCVITTWAHVMDIGNAAHGGGFLFGLAVGYLFCAPRRRLIWALPLAGLVALTILAVTWMPWSGYWTFWKGSEEFKQGRYHAAVAWYQRSLKLGADPQANWNNISLAWRSIAAEEEARDNAPGAREAEAQAAQAQQQAGPMPDTNEEDTPNASSSSQSATEAKPARGKP
jgi:membrane associated rhomboid family serine protease